MRRVAVDEHVADNSAAESVGAYLRVEVDELGTGPDRGSHLEIPPPEAGFLEVTGSEVVQVLKNAAGNVEPGKGCVANHNHIQTGTLDPPQRREVASFKRIGVRPTAQLFPVRTVGRVNGPAANRDQRAPARMFDPT